MIDRAKERGLSGTRLLQATFHNRSLSLYAKLGFTARELLRVMLGHPLKQRAARVYQLQVLFPNIQDDQHNATNFVVIQTAARDFPEQNPTRLIVLLDVKQGDDALAQL